jgi:uncharacterized protein (TIGR00725 family)
VAHHVAVVGPSAPTEPEVVVQARTAGQLIAARGWVVFTGGLGGVMAAAAEGAASEGGTAVALLPGSDRTDAAPGHTLAIATGLGELRNALLVRTVDAVLAVGGSWGTLSEVALAARTGVPVFTVAGWAVGAPHDTSANAPVACASVEEAVNRIAEVLL